MKNSVETSQFDRGISLDCIQEELEDEPLQFKGPMTKARSKRLEDQIIQATFEYEDQTLSTFES